MPQPKQETRTIQLPAAPHEGDQWGIVVLGDNVRQVYHHPSGRNLMVYHQGPGSWIAIGPIYGETYGVGCNMLDAVDKAKAYILSDEPIILTKKEA